MKQKLGKEARTGDHGKWLCGVKTLLQRPGCIVYSIGSDGLTGKQLADDMTLMHHPSLHANNSQATIQWQEADGLLDIYNRMIKISKVI